MRKLPAALCAVLLCSLVLGACSTNQPEPAASAPTSPPPTVAPPTATSQPTNTPEPTATPEPTITPTPEPTATPTATPDPWAEYAPLTIEGLRAREYGVGEIEFVSVMEETANFTRYLIAYDSDGLRITGMLNRPRGEGPFPVVILNHGYYPLDVYQTGNGSKTAADYLANRGFLAIAPDFRSHAGSDDGLNLYRVGHVIDVLNLIPLAQKLPDAQPGKIGIWGHSNGGAVTAKVITVSDQIGAAVIYSPASSNIVEDYEFRVERRRMRENEPPGQRSGVLDLPTVEFPVPPAQGPDLYERLSPLNYLHYVTAPVQIHWGTNDEVVPYKWPGDLLDGLRAAGKEVEYFEYPGQPHSFTGESNQLYLRRIAEFYAERLGQP